MTGLVSRCATLACLGARFGRRATFLCATPTSSAGAKIVNWEDGVGDRNGCKREGVAAMAGMVGREISFALGNERINAG